MLDLICGISVLLFTFQLTKLDFLGEREGRTLTILGWFISLYIAKRGIHHG